MGISSIEWELGPIEHNAVNARYEPDPDYPDAEMQVHLEDIFGIAFGQGESAAYGWDVVLTMRRLENHIINQIVPPLRPFLP